MPWRPSALRSKTSSAAMSPTWTSRCSPWSTCLKWSRVPCSPGTRARRRASAGCSSTSSSASWTSPATPRWTPPSASRRAEDLYERVFFEYGDDSVAQLGGVHLACEQASNVLTKVLERGRLMAYLEQSTRYIPYNNRLDLRPLPLLPRPGPARLAARRPLRGRDGPDVRHLRRAARGGPGLVVPPRIRAAPVTRTSSTARRCGPRHSTPCAACCRRPRCPMSASTAPGSPTSCCCSACGPIRSPEARRYAELMLEELRKVIPSFLQRVDRPDRGGAWSDYLAQTGRDSAALVESLLPRPRPAGRGAAVRARRSALGHPGRLRSGRRGQGHHRHLQPPHRGDRGAGGRRGWAGSGRRSNARCYAPMWVSGRTGVTGPGRAFERTGYRFDVVTDYGAFRDLQRHRMLTIEWQPLGTSLGYDVPDVVDRRRGVGALRRRPSSDPASCARRWRPPSRWSRPTPWHWRTASATPCR